MKSGEIVHFMQFNDVLYARHESYGWFDAESKKYVTDRSFLGDLENSFQKIMTRVMKKRKTPKPKPKPC